MKTVVFETGEERRKTVAAAVQTLGEDFVKRLKSAKKILLKPDLIHHEKQLASTHIDAVRGVLDIIRKHTGAPVIIGDASFSGTKAAFRNFGYEHLTEEYSSITLKDLNDDETVEGYSIRKDGSQNTIQRSKLAHDADLRISLANLKIDRDIGASLSLANWSVGTWVVPSRISMHGRVWARWPWLNEEGALAHHKTIMELYRQLPCDYAIIDGIVAMENDGPVYGTPIQMNVVLAGSDAVAVDAVAATLIEIDPSEIGYLLLAGEENLGTMDMGRIDVPPMQLTEYKRRFLPPDGFEKALAAFQAEKAR